MTHEAELVIRDLARAWQDGGDGWKDVPGVGYKDPSGEIVLNPPYAFVKDLDELPIPDRSLLPLRGQRLQSRVAARPK